MSEFQIGLVARLDSSKSKQQLNSDIEALKKQLTTVEVQAKLGKDVVTNLTQQLNAVQINLNNVKVDQTAINNMISQFNTAFSKVNINLGNINTNGAKKEQSNVASTQVFNTSDLKANNIAYMSKVHNTIEKQMVEINRLANANGWSDVKVTGVEEASGKIQKLTLTVRDAEGALKQFNMQREKIQGNGKTQAGLVQTGDVKVLETAVQYAEKLKSIETSMGQFGNTTTYNKGEISALLYLVLVKFYLLI